MSLVVICYRSGCVTFPHEKILTIQIHFCVYEYREGKKLKCDSSCVKFEMAHIRYIINPTIGLNPTNPNLFINVVILTAIF